MQSHLLEKMRRGIGGGSTLPICIFKGQGSIHHRRIIRHSDHPRNASAHDMSCSLRYLRKTDQSHYKALERTRQRVRDSPGPSPDGMIGPRIIVRGLVVFGSGTIIF